MILSIFSLSYLTGNVLLFLSILIFLALLVTKVGYRFGVPTLLLFLLIGMAAGPDGLGYKIDDYGNSLFMGEFAMSIILMTGGLQTKWKAMRPVMKPGIMLSSVGVMVTVLVLGAFLILYGGKGQGLSSTGIITCFLLAAILSSTDSASVVSILRGSKISLKERIGPMLELESSSNDPMALTLTAVMIRAFKISVESGGPELIWQPLGFFLIQISVGIVMGYGMGKLSRILLHKIGFNNSIIYAIMILTLGVFTNALTSSLMGNGLLALYIASVMIGNDERLPYKEDVMKFMEGLTWLAELLMFLMLGILVKPSAMGPVLLPAILAAVVLIFVARPLSVFIALAPFKGISNRGKLFISWVGMKGPGPILFGMFPIIAGIEGAENVFLLVYLVTLISLMVQGTTITRMARLLKVDGGEMLAFETEDGGIGIGGHIDSGNVQRFEEQLAPLLPDEIGDLRLDAGELSYISSAGLRVLMKLRKQAGGVISIVNTQPAVYNILEMTGFNRMFSVSKAMREIKIEDSPVIGVGAHGKVYRTSPETIVKVYESPESLPMLQREMKIAKAALLKGIPNAISYDVVRVGDGYGLVYELLEYKTFNDVIIKDPGMVDDIVRKWANLLRKMHTTTMDAGEIPAAKSQYLELIHRISGYLQPGQEDRLKELVLDLPDMMTVTHGSLHLKNILVTDHEPLILDMEYVATGHPIFDLAGLYMVYMEFPEDDHNDTERYFGISPGLGAHLWLKLMGEYFGTSEAAVLQPILEKLRLLAAVRFLYYLDYSDRKEGALGARRIQHTQEHINELLGSVDSLNFDITA